MRFTHYLLICLLCSMPLGAFAAGDPATSDAAVTNAEGLHLDWLDRSVNPAQNFYNYGNGTWMSQNPVPADYGRWSQFSILSKSNQEAIHKLLEEAAKNPLATAGSDEQKIGDFYSSGMDETAINQAAIKPLNPEFERITNIFNQKQLQAEIAHLQMIGVNALFGFGSRCRISRIPPK